MREATFRPGARRFYGTLSNGEQGQVDILVALLERDPSVNDITTFWFPVPPHMFRLLDNGIWQLLYALPDDATVLIHSIAHAESGTLR
jgi:hypothetical protein